MCLFACVRAWVLWLPQGSLHSPLKCNLWMNCFFKYYIIYILFPVVRSQVPWCHKIEFMQSTVRFKLGQHIVASSSGTGQSFRHIIYQLYIVLTQYKAWTAGHQAFQVIRCSLVQLIYMALWQTHKFRSWSYVLGQTLYTHSDVHTYTRYYRGTLQEIPMLLICLYLFVCFSEEDEVLSLWLQEPKRSAGPHCPRCPVHFWTR